MNLMYNNCFIARYLPNGQIDTSFNSPNGYITKTFTPGKDTVCYSVAVDSSGNIIGTRSTYDNNDVEHLYLIKYIGENVTSTTTIKTITTITEPICLVAGTPIVTEQDIIAIEKIDTTVHTINNKRILAITKTITP